MLKPGEHFILPQSILFNPFAAFNQTTPSKLVLMSAGFQEGSKIESHLSPDQVTIKRKNPGTWSVNKKFLFFGLPQYFHAKLGSVGSRYLSIESERAINSFIYQFENELQLYPYEMLTHPLVENLKNELVPVSQHDQLGPRFELTKNPMDRHYQLNNKKDTEIRSLYCSLLQRSLRLKIPIHLVAYADGVEMRMQINNLEFMPLVQAEVKVHYPSENQDPIIQGMLGLSVQEQKTQIYEFECDSFSVSSENACLSLQPRSSEKQKIVRVLSQFQIKPDDQQIYWIHQHEQITNILSTLFINGSEQSLLDQELSKAQKASQNQVRAQIDLTDQKAFCFLQEYRPNEGHLSETTDAGLNQKLLKFQNAAPAFYFLVRILQNGIGWTLSDPKKVVTRSSKRDYELAFLKNRGFAYLTIYEVLQFVLHGISSDGQKVETTEVLIEKLKQKMANLTARQSEKYFEYKASYEFKDFYTPAFAQYFDDLIKSIVLKLSEDFYFYTFKGLVQIDDYLRPFCEILRASIEYHVQKSKAEIFLKKSKGPFSDYTFDFSLEQKPRIELSEVASMPGFFWPIESKTAIIPYLKGDFEVLIDGLPIQQLTQDELSFQMSLGEETKNALDSTDWFDLHPEVFLRGQKIPFDQIQFDTHQSYIQYQGQIFKIDPLSLPSVKILERFWSKIQGYERKKLGKNEGSVFHLPRHEVLDLLVMKEQGIPIVGGGERWQRISLYFDQMISNQVQTVEVPASVVVDLKDYQKAGFKWFQDIYQLGLGGILADDMGLGKTVQCLTFLEQLSQRKQLGASLVVVPTSLTYNWISEAQKFTPELPMMYQHPVDFFQGTSLPQSDFVLVTTYGLLSEYADSFKAQKWNVIVFDEAQNLKNIQSQRTSLARSLVAQSKFCLTGTPLENNLNELYSLIDLCLSGSLGSLQDYKRLTSDTLPVEQVTDNRNYLKQKIRPLILRRQKSKVLFDLPEKTETLLKIPFENEQKEIYKKIATSGNQQVQQIVSAKGSAHGQLEMLTALLRLRQVCSDPRCIPNIKYDKVPPKHEDLIDRLKTLNSSGESALVFTQFLGTLERLNTMLQKEGIPVFCMTGKTSRKQREEILQEFQNSKESQVLLMTLKTGGVGLNLTKASYVFHLDPWWNPQVENQATDRVHRMGQSKKVQIYRYVMKDSLEEKIENLKLSKSSLFDMMMNEDIGAVIGDDQFRLSYESFKLLLS